MSNSEIPHEVKSELITGLVLFGILFSYLAVLITLSAWKYHAFTFAFTLLVALEIEVVFLIAEALLSWKMIGLFY